MLSGRMRNNVGSRGVRPFVQISLGERETAGVHRLAVALTCEEKGLRAATLPTGRQEYLDATDQ
jgi:hypothetical protein